MAELYYSPGACSMAIHVVLNELNQPLTLHNASIREGKTRTAEFLAVNPRGQVPVLVEDGQVIREGAAILIYLMEKYQSPMLPKSGKERATALEWLCWANATLHPAYSRSFWLMRNADDGAVRDKLLSLAIEDIEAKWADADKRLGETGAFLGGAQLGAADILVAVIANWFNYFPRAPKLGSNVERLIRSVIARPSYQKALAAEHVEYKAVA